MYQVTREFLDQTETVSEHDTYDDALEAMDSAAENTRLDVDGKLEQQVDGCTVTSPLSGSRYIYRIEY